jgi:curved DNA-binding protein CbpA
MSKDYYAILDLDRDCTDEEIKSTYREAVKIYHPDVAGGDPEKIDRFQLMTEAYKVLIDPFRRKQHDLTLPMKSYPLRRPTKEKVWREVTETVILRSDRIGPFQKALQDALPLALEEEVFVVGFSPENQRESSYLDVAANRYALLDALALVTGKKPDFRYIQGQSPEDWELIKAREERVTARARASETPVASEESRLNMVWDELIARLHRSFSELPRRQQPQIRASFFAKALTWINETATRSYALGVTEEAAHKGLARAIERLANMVELPPTYVAIELARHTEGGEKA